MTALLTALGSGMSAKKIIEFLVKKSPDLAPKIQQALASGFTADQILKFFSKNENFEKYKESMGKKYSTDFSSNPLVQAENVRSQGLANDPASTFQRNVGPVLGTAALTGGAYALSRAIPPILQTMTPQTPQAPQSTESLNPPISNQVSQSITQNTQAVQPKGNITDIFKGMNINDSIDQYAKAGNGPEEIEAYLKKFSPKTIKEIEQASGMSAKEAISAYLADNSAQSSAIKDNSGAIPAQSNEQDKLPPSVPEEKIDDVSTPEMEEKPIAKEDLVSSSKGVGTVLEVRGNEAIIDIDGKKHKVSLDEIQSEPDEVKKSKFDFDLNSISEDLRSAPLNEVYIPYDKRHVSVKYNAGLKPVRYLYFRKDGQPIGNEYINKIVQGVQLPVSSGSSFWGAWDADKADSRGSANHAELVSNSQEEGQKDDPSKEYWFIKEEALYEHPYLEKKGKEELRQMEKEFNEKRKKRKKNPT